MIDLSVELVELLKHADVKGKKLTWNLQVNASAVTVKMIWIKAEKPVATIGEVTSQAPKKCRLSGIISLCFFVYFGVDNGLIPFRLPLV
jgi:hypothetical protein